MKYIAMIPHSLSTVLSSHPTIMSGTVCFAGTRVPVQALLDTIDDGDSVQDFLAGFPDVTNAQVRAVIHWEQAMARQALGLESESGALTAR